MSTASAFSRYAVYIKPVIKNRYVQTYSSVVFSLIAITFFSLFAIRPTFKTIISLRKDIEEQKKVLEQLTNKSDSLDRGIKNYRAIDPVLITKIDTLLPSKASIANLSNDLANIAKLNQASISAIQFQPFEMDNLSKTPTQDSDLKEISFSMNLTGSYASLSRVLTALSSSNHLILIDNINFNKGDNGLIMTILGRTVY